MTVAAEQIAELADRTTEAGRMSRARALFRKGAVSDLVITEGSIVATVRGSEGDRYETTIATAPAPGHVVAEIVRAHDPGDRWSLDDLVTDGLELCPREIDLAFSCDCADWEEPCKHVAATFLAFVDRADLDQADLLRWRGVDPSPDLGAQSSAAEPPAGAAPVRPATASPAGAGGVAPRDHVDEDRSDGRRKSVRSPAPAGPDGDEGPVDRVARLSELESLLGDTVVRVDAGGDTGGPVDADSTDGPPDGALVDFLGVGRSIDPVDPIDGEPMTPLFTEVQLGPLADLGPELAAALATIRAHLDQR